MLLFEQNKNYTPLANRKYINQHIVYYIIINKINVKKNKTTRYNYVVIL